MWREKLRKVLSKNPLSKYLKMAFGLSVMLTFFFILIPLIYIREKRNKNFKITDAAIVALILLISFSISGLIPLSLMTNFMNDVTFIPVIISVTINYTFNYLFFVFLQIQTEIVETELTKSEIRDYRLRKVLRKGL